MVIFTNLGSIEKSCHSILALGESHPLSRTILMLWFIPPPILTREFMSLLNLRYIWEHAIPFLVIFSIKNSYIKGENFFLTSPDDPPLPFRWVIWFLNNPLVNLNKLVNWSNSKHELIKNALTHPHLLRFSAMPFYKFKMQMKIV